MKKSICLIVPLLSGLLLSAQTRVQHAEDATGIVHDPNWANISKYINTHSHSPAAKAASLEKSLKAQIETVLESPIFHPAKGFEMRDMVYMESPAVPGQTPLPVVSQKLNFYYLTKDSKTGTVKKSMDGTMLTIETNNVAHICEDQGSFAEDCKHLTLPVFFEQLPVTDSTADYIELNFKNYSAPHTIPDIPIRLVLRNQKPLFVPFTRKEYFQYLIAKKNAEIKELEKDIGTLQDHITQLKKEVAGTETSTDMKKAMSTAIDGLEKAIPVTREKLNHLKEQQQHYQQLMNAMPIQEAAASAWINMNRMNAQMDYLDILLPYGHQGGMALYKVNPDYFDTTARAPGAQLITVYYNLNQGTFITDLDYLQQKTMQLFEQLNYHQLKESMQ